LVIEVNKTGYHRVIYCRFSRSGTKRNRTIKEKKKQEYNLNLLSSLSRTKKILRRIILNQNFEKTSFLTLTFAENVQDLDVARYEFQKFLKRLNYFLYKTKQSKIKYLAVPERQERGAWHFHILLFDVPFIPNDDIASIWGNGFVKINQVKFQNMMQVFQYISKYITKQFQENQKYIHRFLGSKGFFKGYDIRVFDVDKKDYEQEVQYWIQNIYTKDDYRYVSGYVYEYEVGQQKFFVAVEFYFSKHFYDEIERLHICRVSQISNDFYDDT
jgi:hypothetical protein